MIDHVKLQSLEFAESSIAMLTGVVMLISRVWSVSLDVFLQGLHHREPLIALGADEGEEQIRALVHHRRRAFHGFSLNC